MIIKISSANQYLLDILYKNPNTDNGLYFKNLKKGCIVGNSVNKHLYEVVFQDTKYSYMGEDSNQIDFQSYSSPLLVMHICNSLFSHILKAKDEYKNSICLWLEKMLGDIDDQECMIEIPSFFIDSNWYKNDTFLLSKYFSGVKVEPQTNRIFKLTIKASSVFEAMNLLAVTALFIYLTNDYGKHIYIDEGLIQKYGRILTNIDNVPYFIFYLFNVRTIQLPHRFEEFRPMFENYLSHYGINANLKPLSNQYQREQFVLKRLETKIPILDIGCGEFTYYKRMKSKGLTAPYFAVDEDESLERLAYNIARRYNDDQFTFSSSLVDFESDQPVNILLIEVIEHNPIDEAKALINEALLYNFDQFIITTPNREFNQFYIMDTVFRHQDHDFELSQSEFKELIEDCILSTEEPRKYKVEYYQIGDNLNDITPTQGCVIKKVD